MNAGKELRNIKMRTRNPIKYVQRLRPKENGKNVIPLVDAVPLEFDKNGVVTNTNAAMESLWHERVVSPVIENVLFGFGLGPTSLMRTPIFGPFNSRRTEVKNHLIAEYADQDTRIFYDGSLMGPDHLLLFTILLNFYIRAPRASRTSLNTVVVNRDTLIEKLYGNGSLRTSKGGRSSYYDDTVARLLDELYKGVLKITEGGDKEGTVGKGRGFFAKFLRDFSWDEQAKTFTYAIDYRLANLYALNGHSYIYLGDRHGKQADIEIASLSLQNLFRSDAREQKSIETGVANYKEVRLPLGDLMIRLGALGLTKKVFFDRVITAAIKVRRIDIANTLATIEITGTSFDDTILLSSRGGENANNLIGLSFDQAMKVVTNKEISNKKTVRAASKRGSYEENLAFGVVSTSSKCIVDSNPKTAIEKVDLVAVVAPATDVKTPAKQALGLRGKHSDETDTPAYYIRLKNFHPGSLNFESLANSDGDYPIFESWISDIVNSPAAVQAGLCSTSIRANIEKACLWSERNPHRRKTVAQLNKFLSDWLSHELDKKVGGGDSKRKLTPQERDDQMDAAMAEFLSKRSEKPDEERCVNEDEDEATSAPSGIVIDAYPSADLRF